MLSHSELTFIGKVDFCERTDDLFNEKTNYFALLNEYVLVGLAVLFGELAQNILYIRLVLLKLRFVSDSAHELSSL